MNTKLKQQAINTVCLHSQMNLRYNAIVREMMALSRCEDFTVKDVSTITMLI